MFNIFFKAFLFVLCLIFVLWFVSDGSTLLFPHQSHWCNQQRCGCAVASVRQSLLHCLVSQTWTTFTCAEETIPSSFTFTIYTTAMMKKQTKSTSISASTWRVWKRLKSVRRWSHFAEVRMLLLTESPPLPFLVLKQFLSNLSALLLLWMIHASSKSVKMEVMWFLWFILFNFF